MLPSGIAIAYTVASKHGANANTLDGSTAKGHRADMPLFTRDNAAIMAAKGNSVRWSRPRTTQSTAEPTAIPATVPKPVAEVLDDFTVRKLVRIRDQINRVEGLLDEATEPQAVDRFANALTRLYDLERILAGRPLPGSRRPAPDGKQRGQPSAARPWVPVVAPEPGPSAPTAPSDPQIEPKPLQT